MQLLDQIIASVTEKNELAADVLRRCLVLAYKLKNEALKDWVEKELNGYGRDDALPEYRKAQGVAKGHFNGGWGMEYRNQPLPAIVLKPEHRHFATDITLRQPIASYEGVDSNSTPHTLWPQDLVVMYQASFYDGYALTRAWMEIPPSMMIGLIDTIRTRILTFALQINDELPKNSDASIESIPPAVVEKIVNITIYGGTNVVGDVGQLNAQTVMAGDVASLEAALLALGMGKRPIKELEEAMLQDAMRPESEVRKGGDSTLAWISKMVRSAGGAGLKIGGAALEAAIRRAVFAYLGLGG